MSINSISAATSYYSFSSVGNEDELLKRKLIALGIAPTGNLSVDRNLLIKAEKTQKGEEKSSVSVQQNQPTQQQAGGAASAGVPQEWKNLMRQLGIISSNDVDVDYIKATAEVKQRILYAKDETEKTKYRGIQEKMDLFVSNYHPESSSASSAMVGATLLGEMNKASMVK